MNKPRYKVQMEVTDEMSSVVPCSSIALHSAIRVGAAGTIWGACAGPYEARKSGLTGFSRAQFVANSMGKCTFQCGLVAGVCTLTRCGLQRYRKKDDWKNSFIGGAVAGAAVAARTRSWPQVIGTTCLVSAFTTAANIARTS